MHQTNSSILFILLLLILSGMNISAISQSVMPNNQFEGASIASKDNDSPKAPFHITMNMEAGFQSSPFFKEGTYFQRLNPEISYILSKDFTAFAGVQQTWIQNLNQFQLNHDGKIAITQTNATHMLFYAGGSYQLNPKVRLIGLAWKQTDQQSIIQRKTAVPNFNAQGFQIYMNYQISDNVQINASFNYSQGNPGNYRYNEFQNPFSPIGVSPYYRGAGFGNSPFEF